MTPERWRRIEEVLNAALETGPDQRAALLADSCGGDHELRSEVDSLLKYEADAEQSVAAVVRNSAQEFDAAAVGLAEGDRLGPYRIVREIGRGGMGTVYEAQRDDDQFQKRVAIK